ncbi:MAG: valine--tRNA ligase [Planctomycetales bacterium]|nr:valine--tRNA ligase [Planctomycetales bacterium]
MTREIPKIYDPTTVERQAADLWEQGRYFHADEKANNPKGTYTVVIPPPNVTAALHLGHALNNTLQDILIRWRRMQGYSTLWMPGTDHAGIATQTVVEKRLLAEQGKRRTDFARDEFVAHVQSWKDEYEARILGQLKSMGCSCDWPRTRFTMDEVCARAVRANFFNLFRDGLIYRGKRLVNWDPATQTVLADDEVEHQTVQGFFWYLKYPLQTPAMIDGKAVEHITVATTRPETMLGDTAVAMNPADPRAKYLVGKMVRLPIVGRLIPIIADEHVVLPNPDSDDEKARFSTGFLKVTPAHDPDDWAIGQRHDLAVINVMAPDGSISEKYGWTDWENIKNTDVENVMGMDRFEAREAIVEWFRQENLLEDVRDYAHEIGHSYRSHVPIEPYLSDQWYIAVKKPIPNVKCQMSNVKCETQTRDGVTYIKGTDVPVNSLAGLALVPLLDGRLKFYPERYTKNYQGWLENLRDWPISRQLWWGHQIPIWHKRVVLTEKNWTDELLDVLGWDSQVETIKKGKLDNDFNIRIVRVDDRVEVNPIDDPLMPVIKETEGEYDIYVCLRDETDKASKSNLYLKTLEKNGYKRDEDVLDTWFSSALWPFSTMGWPDENPTLKKFYPTNVLCTAREIITLWVSRMVMMGQYCVGDIPFSDVYIHAMIQDGQGRKMSKSLGNGIDPLVAIDSHGADAMRFTLASMTTDTQDVRMPVAELELPDGRKVNSSPKFDLGRNFCNKLWNASRFAMMNLDGTDADAFDASRMDITDKWILSRLAKTIVSVTQGLETYKYNEPLNDIYKFFWNDFCDWFLEWAKPRMQETAQKPVAQNVLAFVLDQILRLLHPFVPFITEGIFQNLNSIAPHRGLKGLMPLAPADSIMVAAWPAYVESWGNPECEQQIELVQNVVRAVRDIRSRYTIAPAKPLDCSAAAPAAVCNILLSNAALIRQLANVAAFNAAPSLEKPNNAAAAIVEEVQLFVHDVIDPQAERQRLQKQKEFVEKGIKPLAAKLSSENFVSRAAPEVVEQSRQKLKELQDQLAAIEKHLAELG